MLKSISLQNSCPETLYHYLSYNKMKVIILLTVSAVLYTCTAAAGVPDPMRRGAVAGIYKLNLIDVLIIYIIIIII